MQSQCKLHIHLQNKIFK